MPIRMFVAVTFLVVSVFLAGPIGHSGVKGAISQKQQQKAARYSCPMDPEVSSTKPGKCPKCGMALRLAPDKIDASTPDEAPGDAPFVSSSKIPDVRIHDQNGASLRFYSDLVKDKTVAINFIFTTCTTICPSLTATFRRVQQDLMQHAPDVQLISISVDPTIDTPDRLREFAARFKAGPRWTFVTGEKTEIDSLLRALGAAVADKNDHTPMILIGNDRAGYWTRSFGLSSPESLVKVIADVASRK